MERNPESGGGTLHDLGPHLADQALVLFGKPEAVSADVVREKDGPGANDSITIRLRYPGLTVTLGANSLSLPARPRFHLRGTKGSYWKSGVDPQEAALNKITRIEDPAWGQEPPASGASCTRTSTAAPSAAVPALPGDYRLFYAGIRDAAARHCRASGHRHRRLARCAPARVRRAKLRGAPRDRSATGAPSQITDPAIKK